MAQKRKTDQNQQEKITARMIDAAIALARTADWNEISLADVAKKARLRMADAEKYFDDVWDILIAYFDRIGRDAQAETGALPDDNWRENLMELVMTQFDLMREAREAIAEIPDGLDDDLRAVPKMARAFLSDVARMLDYAGFPAAHPLRPLAVPAFGAIYLSLLRVYVKDDTPDAAKTMAAVDRRCGWFEKAFSCSRVTPAA